MQDTQNRQQERLTLCLKSLRHSLEYRLRTSACAKTLGKNLLFPSWYYIQTCLTQQERNLNGRRVAIGIFPDDLEQVIDNVAEHKIASEEVTPKLIKDWLEQRKMVSQSFYASSGVAFSGNNDL